MSNEHNNAPAVPQGLERYEPTVMVEESRGRLTATGAVMKPKEDGRWVRLRDLTATPAPAPAQDFDLTDEEIEAIAQKHMSTVGDHWCNEEAIRERHAEDFARAIIAALRAKGQS